MSKSEWMRLAERLEAANPEAYEDILARLRRLVESCEAQVERPSRPATPCPPRSRISQ